MMNQLAIVVVKKKKDCYFSHTDCSWPRIHKNYETCECECNHSGGGSCRSSQYWDTDECKCVTKPGWTRRCIDRHRTSCQDDEFFEMSSCGCVKNRCHWKDAECGAGLEEHAYWVADPDTENCDCIFLCSCEDQLPEGATATWEDFGMRIIYNYDPRDRDNACWCNPKEFNDECNPIYGGMWPTN